MTATPPEEMGPPRFAAATDVGLVRANNEDAYLAAPPLFAVADGMGGHRAGEVASAAALRALREGAGHDTDSLVAAVHAANRAVHAEATANPDLAGMGTTITALMASAGSAQIVHVGDSRAYLFRDGRLRRLTQDHTVVDRLAREGKIPAEEVERHPQRSVLERALGVSPEVDVDVQLLDVRPGDRMLLSTDGLTSMLADDEIGAILLDESDPQVAADRLIEEALAAGGKDNVTAVVVDFPRRNDPKGADGGDDFTRTAEQPAIVLDGGPPYGNRSRQLSGRAQPREVPSKVTTRSTWTPGGPTGAEDPQQNLPGRAPRPRRPRAWLGVVIVIPLLVIGAIGGYIAARSSWYVGEHSGNVAVFRGVPGSFAGIKVSTLMSATNIPTSSLPPLYQQQVRDGIVAKSRSDAEHTAENLRRLQVVSTPTTPTGPGSTLTASASPAPPSPKPSGGTTP